MAHGTPDWGLVGPKQTTFGLDDLGEHAVRLGSPHLADRRGDVLWLTDFDEGIGPLIVVFNGAGGSVDLMTEHSRQGPYALELVCGAAPGDQDAYARMTLSPTVLSAIGSECTFGYAPGLAYWHVQIRYYDGTNVHTGNIRFNQGAQSLQYWDNVTPWVDIAAGLQLVSWVRAMHTMKLVIDPSTVPPTFVRAILNTTTYPLTGIPLVAALNGLGPFIEFDYRNQGVGANIEAYLDNVIITHNEPLFAG